MQAPLPADFDATIIKSDDTLAAAFVKLIRFAVLLTRWFFAWYNADGSFTQDFKDRLCAACRGSN